MTEIILVAIISALFGVFLYFSMKQKFAENKKLNETIKNVSEYFQDLLKTKDFTNKKLLNIFMTLSEIWDLKISDKKISKIIDEYIKDKEMKELINNNINNFIKSKNPNFKKWEEQLKESYSELQK